MTLTELFETFRESAFRLETLQYYVLGEDEPRRQAFREGRPLPPRPGKTESMRLVQAAVAARQAQLNQVKTELDAQIGALTKRLPLRIP